MAQAGNRKIGGSGLYSMPGVSDVSEMRLETPFGAPSDPYLLGTLEGRKVAFLARHRRRHRILPTELNFRANIHGFKQLGVDRIISVSAVGSLKEEHKPLDFVIPDQFFDRTRHRVDASLAMESLLIFRWLIRYAEKWLALLTVPVNKQRFQSNAAVRICAWRARSSPPKPSRMSIEVLAWT